MNRMGAFYLKIFKYLFCLSFLTFSPSNVCTVCDGRKKREKNSIFVHGALITFSFTCVNYFVWFVMLFNIYKRTMCDATAQNNIIPNPWIHTFYVCSLFKWLMCYVEQNTHTSHTCTTAYERLLVAHSRPCAITHSHACFVLYSLIKSSWSCQKSI